LFLLRFGFSDVIVTIVKAGYEERVHDSKAAFSVLFHME
jgi:hypothetical protein